MSSYQPMEDWNEMKQPTEFDALDFGTPWMAENSQTPEGATTHLWWNHTVIPGNLSAGGASQHDAAPEDPAQATAKGFDIKTFRSYLCPIVTCSAAYLRRGDLTRHRKEKHSPLRYLCPVHRCPQGIEGEGFGRMHHLVTHLRSGKHKMGKADAEFEAKKHNLPKNKAREAGAGEQAVGM